MEHEKVMAETEREFIREERTSSYELLLDGARNDNNPYGTDVFFSLDESDPESISFGYPYRNNISWMSFINDSVRLHDLVIPGTHNSGTYSMRSSSVVDLYARTQSYNVLSQLLFGIRYLDLRCKINNGDVVIHHGGVTGRTLRGILNSQIMPFVENVPGEFIILDFQELSDNCSRDVINILNNIAGFTSLCVPSSQLNAQLTMGAIRSGGYRFAVLFPASVSESWISSRSSKLWSPYDESIYKGSTSDIPPYVDKKTAEWEKKGRNTLFVAQLISTTTVSPPTLIESRDGWILNDWVKSQTKDSSVNIIMRDFVDRYPSVIGYIIGLNLEKEYVAAAEKERFKLINQIPEYTIQESNYVYTIGEATFPGSSNVYSERVQRTGGLGTNVFEKTLILEKEMAITYISISDNWKDGTNGSYSIESGGRFLDGSVKIVIKSALFRGLDWTITVKAAPVEAAYFYGSAE